jgi:hypothetical protein
MAGTRQSERKQQTILDLYSGINWTVYPSTNDGNGSDFEEPSNVVWSNSTQLEAKDGSFKEN